MAEKCRHGRRICSHCVVISDAAKRAADIINAYVTFVPFEELTKSWVAIRLSDGGSDGVMYASKRDAIRHQSDEYKCAYFSYRSSPAGTSARDMALWMDMHRAAYDRGMRFVDPESMTGGPDMILPTTREHLYGQRSRLIIPGALQ